jgi:tetratricopeptide (TPR) repeat protein
MLAFVFILCAALSFARLPLPQDSEGLFSKARAQQDSGEWKLAEALYRQFLEQTPGSAEGHSNLGIVYVHEGKFPDAIHEYQAALQIDPSLVGVYLNLGILYYHQGDFTSAVPVLDRFLAADPQNRQAQELLGLCDLELDRYQDALKMLEPLRAGASADVLIALSACYVRLRRMSEAEGILRELLESSPSNSAQVHFLMGQTYAGLDNFPQALKEFKSVAALDAAWPEIHLLIGATEARVGRRAEAEADLRAELQTAPQSFEALFTLGALLNKESRFGEAKPILLKAEEVDSRSGAAAFQLADAYWKTGSPDNAWQTIQRAVGLDPGNGQAHYLYAQIARQRRDETTARREFAMAESLNAKAAEQDILRLSEEGRQH